MKKFVTIMLLSVVVTLGAMAQEVVDTAFADSIFRKADVEWMNSDTLALEAPKPKKEKRDWTTWKPNPKKAMWLAIAFPGAGQIYNRKYWKLPIVYGGFVGCVYAWRWNGQMYNDYQKAYMDISDDDDSTNSYESFLHLGMQINDSNKERFKEIFRKRKDMYRRWRDLSIFATIGVYVLSIVDAYVDASLSQFDISEDLSMKIAPAFLNSRGQQMTASRDNSLQNTGVGVRCTLGF